MYYIYIYIFILYTHTHLYIYIHVYIYILYIYYHGGNFMNCDGDLPIREFRMDFKSRDEIKAGLYNFAAELP